jgi:hypothetical protein
MARDARAVPDALPDPCPSCGFDGRNLRPPDIVAALRSLGRRWEAILSRDAEGPARAHAQAALAGLAAAARTLHADVGAPEPTAEGIAAATTTIADALEGPDQPFERSGVQEAAVAAVHAGSHHLRLAEKAQPAAEDDDEDA